MYLRAGDTISGQEGQATAVINGNVEPLFFVKELEAKFEKEKTEVKTLGHRGTQHKGNGWSGSGSMTLFYVSTLFRKMALKYAKEGKDTYFDITVVNNDPTSTIGKQTIVLYNCNVDSLVVAKLNTDSETLDEDIDFTFEDFDVLDEFGKPAQL